MELTIKELYQILQNEAQGVPAKKNIKAAEAKFIECLKKHVKEEKLLDEFFFLAIDLCMEYADNAFEDGFRIAAALFSDSFKPAGLLN